MKHYLMESTAVLQDQATTKNGLDEEQVSLRRQQYGLNKLEEGKKKSLFAKLWDQISDPMVIVLIVAAVISGVVGEIADAVIILMVVVLNAILGVEGGKSD